MKFGRGDVELQSEFRLVGELLFGVLHGLVRRV